MPTTATTHLRMPLQILLVLGLAALLASLVGCVERTPEQSTDRYINGTFAAFVDAGEAQRSYMDAQTDAQRQAAINHLQTELRSARDTVARLDRDNVHPEALAVGNAVVAWLDEQQEIYAEIGATLASPRPEDGGALLASAIRSTRAARTLDGELKKASQALKQAHGYTSAALEKVIEATDNASSGKG